MSTDTFRINEHLPSLYIPHPRCGHCFEDVTIEDGYAWCDNCLIQWHRIEEDVEATPDENREGTEVPCGIKTSRMDPSRMRGTDKRYLPGPPDPCILPSGHVGEHLCPYDVEVTR